MSLFGFGPTKVLQRPRPQTPLDGLLAERGCGEALSDVCMEIIMAHPAGLTADEIASKAKRTVLAVRPAITRLYQAKRLRKTGLKRPNISGVKATVWAPSDWSVANS